MSYQPSPLSEAKASCDSNGRRNIDIDAAVAAVAMTSMNNNTTNLPNFTTTVTGAGHSHRQQPTATVSTTLQQQLQQYPLSAAEAFSASQQQQQEQLAVALQQLLQGGGSSQAGSTTVLSQVQQLSNLLGLSISIPPIPQQQPQQQRQSGRQAQVEGATSTTSVAAYTHPSSSNDNIPAVEAKAVLEATGATTATPTTTQSSPFCQAAGCSAVGRATKSEKKRGNTKVQQRKLPPSHRSSSDDTMSDDCNDNDEDGKIGRHATNAKTTAIQVASTYVTALEVAGEGSRIAPCHARGMPKTHNAKTAFFVLYKGMKHGEALLCSHKACSERGVRFAFCSVCDQPVAVGNFTSRHSHKDVLANGNDKMATGNKDCRRSSSKTKPHKKRKESSVSSKSSLIVNHGRSPPKKQKTRLSSHDMLRKQSIDTPEDHAKTTAVGVAQSYLYYAESGGANDDHAGANVLQNTGSATDSVESSNSSSSSSRSSSYEEYASVSRGGRDRPSMDVVIPPSTVIPIGGDDYKKKSKKSVITHAHNNDDDENRKKGGSNNRGMRVDMWLKLLSKRPRDTKGDDMSAWLMAAVAVSDPEADVANNVAVQRFMGSLED